MPKTFLPEYSQMLIGTRYRPLFRLFTGENWRYVRKDGQPVECDGGKPLIFASEAEAWQAVTTHLLRYFNSPMFRCGETVKGAARAQADKLFRPGKKPIPVETMRARA